VSNASVRKALVAGTGVILSLVTGGFVAYQLECNRAETRELALVQLANHLSLVAERYEIEHDGYPASTRVDWRTDLGVERNPYTGGRVNAVGPTAQRDFIGNFSYLLCYCGNDPQPAFRQIIVYAPARWDAPDGLLTLWPEDAGWCGTGFEDYPVLARGLTPAAALEKTREAFADARVLSDMR
jgi:hypothetical protein